CPFTSPARYSTNAARIFVGMKSVIRFCISLPFRCPAEPPDACGENTAGAAIARPTNETEHQCTSMVFNAFLYRLVTKRTHPENPPPGILSPPHLSSRDGLSTAQGLRYRTIGQNPGNKPSGSTT
ncbi:unnamed protein product, partial [Ectocarpus sp. 12 AP-2014]